MADHSAIQWTDATWNPTTGCTKVSPGCAHCYIAGTTPFRMAGNRFVKGKTDITIFHDRLEQPLHWRKPRRVFVNSLSDLFHDDIGDAFIDRVFAVMASAPQHTYQVLTKRPARMRSYFEEPNRSAAVAIAAQGMSKLTRPFTLPDERIFEARPVAYNLPWMIHAWPLPNVWLGVSVENQHFADERIPLLLQTPAAVRFISAEPLLGPVNLQKLDVGGGCDWDSLGGGSRRYGAGGRVACYSYDSGPIPSRLDWVIDGAESGPGARDYRVAWSLSLQQQCAAAGVAYFRKQVGRHPIVDDLTHWRGAAALLPAGTGYRLTLRHKKGGDPSEWPADLRVREFPEART